mmetsp:Transcript_29572/g.48169  ORF Transcript_29572/g.48169 Transcript_29572/m.48169 type:complete len:248 (+) Transcript_29572:647-1390(+)
MTRRLHAHLQDEWHKPWPFVREPRRQQRSQNTRALTITRAMVTAVLLSDAVHGHLFRVLVAVDNDRRRLTIPLVVRQIGRDIQLQAHNVAILALLVHRLPVLMLERLPRHHVASLVQVVRVHELYMRRVHHAAAAHTHQQRVEYCVVLDECEGVGVRPTPFVHVMDGSVARLFHLDASHFFLLVDNQHTKRAHMVHKTAVMIGSTETIAAALYESTDAQVIKARHVGNHFVRFLRFVVQKPTTPLRP